MSINPDIIYINLSSAATPSSTFLSLDPEAVFNESRLEPILADVSRYQMCIVRAALQGQRNFPLLIASIQSGQTNPFLTNYQLRLTINVNSPTYVAPTLPTRQFMTLFLYDAAGKQQAGVTLSVFAAGLSTAAEVVLALLASMVTFESVFPFLNDVDLAAVADSAGNPHLQFTFKTPANYQGWYLAALPRQQQSVAYFGFPDVWPQNATEGLVTNGDNAGLLALPLPCSYVPGSGRGLLGSFTSAVTPLMWQSQVSGVAPPFPPVTSVDEGNTSYWLYDYSWWSRMFNATLETAYQDIIAQATNAGIVLQTQCPYITYERSTQGFVLSASPAAVGQSTNSSETMSLWLNELTSNLMAWPGTYDASGNETVIWDSSTLSSDGSQAELRPDYAATANAWSPVGSLVFKASQWMVRQEIMSAPRLFGSGIDAASSGGSSTNEVSQILSDVIPAVGDGSDWNAAQIIYAPQVLRWVELTGGASPLRELDFSVWWRNAATGRMYPVTLNPCASFSVKIQLHRVR